MTLLTNFIAMSLFSTVRACHQRKSPFVMFVQLQSRLLLLYQLMFTSMQNRSNLVKMYSQRREDISDGLKVHSQDYCFPTKEIL